MLRLIRSTESFILAALQNVFKEVHRSVLISVFKLLNKKVCNDEASIPLISLPYPSLSI
jgi:hypothetical protein